MNERDIVLPWGDEEVSLCLPEGWHLRGVLEPAPKPGVDDPIGEVERSLENPSGSPRLGELVEEGMAVAVVIDDLSRPTPVDVILPAGSPVEPRC
jgi:nickel-dependent lactate racemase